MADNASGNSKSFFAFIVGGAVVAALGFGFYAYQQSQQSPAERAVHNAAAAVGSAASDLQHHN